MISESESIFVFKEAPHPAEPALSKVNLHGSILMQQLFRFGNPEILVKSLQNLKPTELLSVSCDACGSHVMDAFLKSPAIGEKSREAVLDRLKASNEF